MEKFGKFHEILRQANSCPHTRGLTALTFLSFELDIKIILRQMSTYERKIILSPQDPQWTLPFLGATWTSNGYGNLIFDFVRKSSYDLSIIHIAIAL